MQRVFNITPCYPEMRVLLEDGLSSGLAMKKVGKRKFVKKHAKSLGGEEKAREVYTKAEHVHATALNVYMKNSVAFNSPLPYVISGEVTKKPAVQKSVHRSSLQPKQRQIFPRYSVRSISANAGIASLFTVRRLTLSIF